jgi:hypothetical protein
MFLKVPVLMGEDDGLHTEAQSEGGVADQLAVLDSMQIFRLGKLLSAIAQLAKYLINVLFFSFRRALHSRPK